MSRNWLLFLGIFLLSALFRITNLNFMEFKTDEAVNLLLAMRPLFGQPLTPGGTVSSLGVLNPPFFNYLLLPIALLNRDPRFVALIIALINSLSISFLLLIFKKYYNERIALISTSLLALSPWAILYSRKIWMQDLLIPFFVLLIFCIHKLIYEKKKIYWTAYTAISLLLVQLHPISIFLIGIMTIFLIKALKPNYKLIIIGLIIGLLPLIPYLIYETKNSCPDCKNLIEAQGRLNKERSVQLFLRPLQIPNEGDFRFVLGNDTLIIKNKFFLLDDLRRIFYL